MQQFRSTGMDGKLELRRGALRVVAGSLLDDFCCRSSFKNCKMNDPSKVNIGKERVMIWDIFFRTLPCTRKFVQNLFCVYCGITSLHLQVIDQRFCHWKATMKGPSAEQAVEWRSYLCQKQCSELRGSGVGDDLQGLARGVGPRFRSLPITLNL